MCIRDRLCAATSEPVLRQRTHAVAQKLQSLVPVSGGLGKQGKIYVFDSCIAINGLLNYKKYLNQKVSEGSLLRMATFVTELLRHRLILLDQDLKPSLVESHWSKVFGASMLKTVIALDALTQETGDTTYLELGLEIAEEVVAKCFNNGYFRIFSDNDAVYCHAHCYALEGLLHLQARGYTYTNVASILKAGVEQLQTWQNDDGSLYNWYNSANKQQLKVTDATAQAIRIWLAVDRQAYSKNIERGLNFLARCQSSEGGLYYHAGSKDVNSWASIFALQALDWYYNGVRADCIV
ncbi:MAG: hypothetical protein AB4038_03775, partial [Prochloraceae cyanobacterium]